MAEIIKSIEEIENLFRLVVLTILKLDPATNSGRVRFPWGSNLKAGIGSAPGWRKSDNICVIYSLPFDDIYNRQRNRRYRDPGGRDLIMLDEHTDVHIFNFVNYGPDAYECARDIRDGLFTDEIRRLLKKNEFSLVTDASAIKRVPELFDTEWWNRVDFSATFNEFVRRESVTNVIEEVTVSPFAISGGNEELSPEATVTVSEED